MLYPENVIWQSTDGTWNLGFYDAYVSNEDIGFDFESLDRFMYVSSNHSSVEEAESSWLGTNLGSDGAVYYQDETNQQDIALLEQLKAEYMVKKNHSMQFVLN